MVASTEAYVTLLTRDDYGLGAIVLAHSLRDAGTTRKLVCLVTDKVSPLMLGRVKDVFDELVMVEAIKSTSLENLKLLNRPELIESYTKLHLWRLTQYTKVVFMDADTVALQNVDELFTYGELSAAADAGWPDIFNSGVFVAIPAEETFKKLLAFAETHESFDGGDQGVLNDFFKDWNRLPFVYNVTPSSVYSYAPAYRHFRDSIRIAHFAGMEKPWCWDRYSDGSVMARGRGPAAASDIVRLWWLIHDRHLNQWAPDGHKMNNPGYSLQYNSSPSGSSSTESHEAHVGQQRPLNPFFKSRYDWNENELGLKQGSSKGKALVNTEDIDEEGRKVPLKKSAPASAAPSKPSSAKAVSKK